MEWPDLVLDAPLFTAFVGQKLDPAESPLPQIRKLAIADLYLILACLVGLPPAAARFLGHVRGPVERAVRRIDPSAIDDIVQNLFTHLFLSQDGRPKAHAYRGQGDLRRWVAVVAVRLAVDERRRGGRLSRRSFESLESSTNAEDEYFRAHYRHEFKAAFAQTIATLDDRQRNVLRYHMSGLTADQIGRMYRVHRVTVARWLSRIRGLLFDRTRAILMERFATKERDLESILRLIDSQLSLSLDGIVPV